MSNDDRILLNLVLNEATVSAVEGRVRNLVNRLNNTNISLNIDARNLNNIENQFNRIQQQMQTINATPVNINANLTSAQQQYRLETERLRVSQQLELSRQRTLQTENQAISALAQQNRTLTVNNNVTHQIEQGAQNIGHNMNVAGGHARDFVDYLSDGVRYLVTYRSLYAIMNQIGEAFSEMKSVDSAAIQVRKATGMSKDEIEAIKKSSYGVATEYGRSASEYLESVSEFARAGYKQHSTELGKLSLLTQNVGDVSAGSADKMLLAVDAAYQLEGNVTELTNVVNALNNIANKNPTSMQKMADGLQVSASMAKTAGMDISELTALIGTGTAVTQREGAEVARAIRTIVMNVKSVKGELEDGTIIDDESIAKAEAALKGVGISTKEVVNGVRELRNPMEVLDELADKWHTLGTEAKSVLTESIANKRQANVLSGILDNWSMVEKMQSEYFNSANSAIEENILYLEGWEAKSKVVSAKWTEYISNLADTKVITGTLDALYSLLTALDTPIGRIVTQIVLVNTALAVTGRLWQQIRARSIVAEILSIGVADRQLGTAIGLVTEHLGRQALAWATSPFGMATIAVAGITLITSAIEKNSQKLEENAQKAGEAYDKVKQNMNELDDLIKQYNDLQISNEWDNTPVETKKQLHEDINRLLGDEADKVDILNGKYKETTEELFKQRMSKLPEEEKKAFDNEQAKGKSLWDTAYWNGGGGAGGYNYGTMQATDSEKKFIEKYEKIFDEKYYSAGRGMGSTDYVVRFDNFDDFMMKYEEAKKMLQELYDEGMGESELYKGLNSFIAKFDTKVGEYKTAVEELESTKAGQKLADYINTSVGGYVDDLDEYKIVVDWIKSNFTGKDADNALGLLNSYFSEYAEKVSKTNEMLGQEGLSIQLSDLEGISDKIGTLSSAFKELSDDGYITFKTLGEIKEATGLSGNEWDEYETKLRNVKAGSAEFNQIMGELTYAILQNKFGVEGLANATEEDIAAVLRENGVLNANELAHKVSAKAKADNALESYKLGKATYEDAEAMIKEAMSAEEARIYLARLELAKIAVNNAKINTTSDVEQIINIANAAGAGALALSQLARAKYLLMKQGSGKQLTFREIEDLAAIQSKIANGTFNYDFDPNKYKLDIKYSTSSGGSSSGSSKNDSKKDTEENKALKEHLERAEQAYKYHEDELRYIADLQYAYNNLCKIVEEQLDIDEKINEARKDYADNQIKDLEHINELLENQGLKGNDEYIANLQRIKDVAHTGAEAYRELLRGMGYDDETINKTGFIQDMQSKWWDADKKLNDIIEDNFNDKINDIEHSIKLLENLNKQDEDFDDNGTLLNRYNRTQEINDYYRQLQDEIHKRADELRSQGYADDVEEIQELQDKWWEFEDSIRDNISKMTELKINSYKEQLEDEIEALDLQYDKEAAIIEALKKQNDLKKQIRDKQAEISADLDASKQTEDWLDENTRELLFNEKDYAKLSKELKKIDNSVSSLYKNYRDEINKLNENEWYKQEEITAQFQARLGVQMESYELLEKELEIAKKRTEYENIAKQRNTRVMVAGRWVQTADTEKLYEASKSLATLKAEKENLAITNAENAAVRGMEAINNATNTERLAIQNRIDMIEEMTELERKAYADRLPIDVLESVNAANASDTTEYASGKDFSKGRYVGIDENNNPIWEALPDGYDSTFEPPRSAIGTALTLNSDFAKRILQTLPNPVAMMPKLTIPSLPNVQQNSTSNVSQYTFGDIVIENPVANPNDIVYALASQVRQKFDVTKNMRM